MSTDPQYSKSIAIVATYTSLLDNMQVKTDHLCYQDVAFAMRNWPLLMLLPTFSLSFFLFLSSPTFAFDPLRGNSRG